MEGEEPPLCPSPSPFKTPFTFFKDITNFKTPRCPSRNSNFHSPAPQYFTAFKQTPSTNSSFRRRPSLAPSNSGRTTAAARKIKAFELEQLHSSRKAQILKEQSLKSLAQSLTVWLNFLFQNPKSCGCNFSADGDHIGTLRKGKRVNEPASAVRVDSEWRDPKRQKDFSWRAASTVPSSSSKYLSLQSTLEHVCSVDDLTQRMRLYLSMESCKEVFYGMSHVAKSIDEGRLKMKAHCPLVTDFGLKERVTRILMSYNPIWFRIGLYIVFGGDSLLSDSDINSDEEIRFLKMIIEKQFFAHARLAKEYAYNKMVEGLYRPGYYEALGNVILKRFLLLVIILDRAKGQSSLSLKYGIDGVDGGSPRLFAVESSIKSSHQMIHDFLSSDVMLGEGNILAHLVILGYKVSYQQHPLVEFDFGVADLFVDLQDGVRLCRAIQLLQDDTSILTYLKQNRVDLHDEDGMMIEADDIAGGDKELSLSLLWNMFVHLQLPLLVKKTDLAEEISKIRGNVDNLISIDSSSLDILLKWIQAICENYDCKVDTFSSLVDGKAIWCLLDYYFRKQLCWSSKDPDKLSNEESIMLATDYSDAVHNFLLSQKLLTLLGNFPEVLQISDILEHNGARNDRSVVILLVFLSSQLIFQKNMDQLNFHKLLGCECQTQERKYSCTQCSVRPHAAEIQEGTHDHSDEDSVMNFKAIHTWWQDMAERNHKFGNKPDAPTLDNFCRDKDKTNITKVNAAKKIQSHFRRATERRKFLKMLNAADFLQTVVRAWLSVQRNPACIKFTATQDDEFQCDIWRQPETWRRYIMFFIERHGFVKLKKSALLIQRAARNWIICRHLGQNFVTSDVCTPGPVDAAIVVQSHIRGWLTRSRYICGDSSVHQSLCPQHFAAAKIQSSFRSWLLRKRFHVQRQAILRIQSAFRMSRCWKAYQQYKTATTSATIIQSYVRACVARRGVDQRRRLIVEIQRYCRGWLVRSYFLCQRKAAVKIQNAVRCFKCCQTYNHQREAATEIQRVIRGQISRNRLLDSVMNFKAIHTWWQAMAERDHKFLPRPDAPTLGNFCTDKDKINITKENPYLILTINAAMRIQSHFRRAIERRKFLKMLNAAALLQTVVRAWLNVQRNPACIKFTATQDEEFQCDIWRQPETWRRYIMFITERHGFITLKKSALLIQRAARNWIICRHRGQSIVTCNVCTPDPVNAAIVVQRHIRGWLTRSRYIRGDSSVRQSLCSQHSAATKFQSRIRIWLLRRRRAILRIQSAFRMSRCWKAYQKYKIATASATIIQSYVRACIVRRGVDQRRHFIVEIQRYCRGWLIRSYLLCQREAAVKIQGAVRCFKCCQAYNHHREAAVEIQRVIRGQISRNWLLGASSLRSVNYNVCFSRATGALYKCAELKMVLFSVLKLQRWWRGMMALKIRTKSAVIIQSHVRGWIERQKDTREKECVIVIQSYWRGYLARKKETGGQLLDLRLRVQKSATNVDDSMRIINRLVAALSELETMKSVSGVLHTCATLDKATAHSQKCCERLVEAGAINTLLRLFRSASRSIPDQEVLKHVLSTLRNLARYPPLVEMLIDAHGSVETVLTELLRNKEEGYFIASELLKKILTSRKGVEAVRKSPAHFKRLHSLVEELSRKANNEKRNTRVTVAREITERRLKEAIEILKLAKGSEGF